MIELAIVVSILFGGGFWTGKTIYEKPVIHNHLTCPKIKKPNPIETGYFDECLEDCNKEFIIKINRESSADVHRLSADCKSFQETTFKLIDTYNETVEDKKEKLEKENKNK